MLYIVTKEPYVGIQINAIFNVTDFFVSSFTMYEKAQVLETNSTMIIVLCFSKLAHCPFMTLLGGLLIITFKPQILLLLSKLVPFLSIILLILG